MSERKHPHEYGLQGLAALVRRQTQRRAAELREARSIAEMLGVPANEQYAIRSALFDTGLMPSAEPATDSVSAVEVTSSIGLEDMPIHSSALDTPRPTYILEIARGAAHVAQFVRSFLGGQSPPAFQLSSASLQARGSSRDETLASPSLAGIAGPVSISLVEDHTHHEVGLTAQLQETDVDAAIVRLYRGHEGAETPPELIATFELSRDVPEHTHHLSATEVDVLHLEVEPQ